ncbi:DNA-directed RNA polymerase subunit beta [Spiroplasma endosymbiont of Amphibalanus improvisus]|uniref:DNA-directed RNA polymerase subunit beta n=1 Tax=Spiroplasma endosymbiont of Amphibalanus improvisus TaxID=3066327 RepID=UPI00313B3AEF
MEVKTKLFGNYSKRLDYTKVSGDLDLPNLIEIQTEKFDWLIKEGINEVLNEIFPILGQEGNVTLSLDKWWINDFKKDKFESREESKTYEKTINAELSLTYFSDNNLIPFESEKKVSELYLIKKWIKAKAEADFKFELKKTVGDTFFFDVKVIGDETLTIEAEITDRDKIGLYVSFNINRSGVVFFGELPWMTDKGTFIINGSEKIVVSQLVRSPGAYYKIEFNPKNGASIYKTDLIPSRGTWLEFESDILKSAKKINSNESQNIFHVKIDKSRKVSVTTLMLALGISKNNLLEIFDNHKALLNTYELDSLLDIDEKDQDNAAQDIYKKIRLGEVSTPEGSKRYLYNILFDKRKYDLTKAGRFKLLQKLLLENRLVDKVLAEDLKDAEGKVLFKKETLIKREDIKKLKEHFKNGASLEEVSFNSLIPGSKKIQRIKVYKDNEQRKETMVLVGIDPNSNEEHITVPDIIAVFSYLLNLTEGLGQVDDIDHLGNRRVRTVGELLQNQFRIGLLRIEKNAKEKMSTINMFKIKPSNIFNNKPLTAVIGEFFNLSQLSQFMDQTNPLSELTNKRRLTALGPGGLSRDRAGLEVRDVHYSHYGRICPIETPEGPNIGLINNLSTYAKVNPFGFIETPYRKVEKGIILNESEYLTANDEQKFVVAQANIQLDDKNKIIDKDVIARFQGENVLVPSSEVDYVDVSPKQIVSVATSCIPFLENDDANRALMGANMQRQAVPLLKPQAPYVGTGIEHIAARDSGLAAIAKVSGVIDYVDAKKIIIKDSSNKLHEYRLDNFVRSNQGTSLTHTVLVKKGQKVTKGQILADGPSMENGELALGQNLLVAFTTWNGYNYEDAIIISERLVSDDIFTSIHIEEFSIQCVKTKQGSEEITREIPNVSDNSRKFLDEDGLVMVGTEVQPGDILVGKVTPKGQSQQSPEDKLLHAIFGEKFQNVKDNSLIVPNGIKGTVQAVKRFSSENYDLPKDVKEIIKVYIVQKRKIKQGDKIAGRHGNKGVISIVLPVEDMPFTKDGTPIDVMLNPLGVPSRMNIGQILELHLGMAAKTLNLKVATPVFDGMNNEELIEIMEKAKLDNFGKQILIDGQTGEEFHNPIAVGVMYMLKLSHMVDDKLHARNVGPYSLITQQPLGGKAQNGGQRFGEMEVWALEAHGAAYTLREMLTIKSDDIKGRKNTYRSIVKNMKIPEPSTPESFNVLIKEINGLGFSMQMFDEKGNVQKFDNNYNDFEEEFEPELEEKNNKKDNSLITNKELDEWAAELGFASNDK